MTKSQLDLFLQNCMPLSNKNRQNLEVSIIMPCLNESHTLPQCIARAKEFIKKTNISTEIIVGDNGSTDGSPAIARKLGAKVVNIPQRGYGAAIYGACMAARGRYLIIGDADDSYHFDEIEPLVNKLRAGYDLVMGNRFAGGIEPGAMPWKNRYLGNPILSFLGRVFFKTNIRDFHCGLRGVSKEAFLKMDLRTSGMEFASEMVIKATLKKMKVTEVPVKLYKDGRNRKPHLRPWRDGWRHLRFMLLYSPRWLFLYPGIILSVVGFFLGMYVYPQMRHLGQFNLDIHTLLYAAAMFLLGFQAILYSYLAKTFAIREGLLASDSLTSTFDKFFQLEWGVVLGLLLFLVGLWLAVLEFLQWRQTSFGNLNVSQSMRNVILSATLLILGLEIVLFSFFASVLKLKTRKE